MKPTRTVMVVVASIAMAACSGTDEATEPVAAVGSAGTTDSTSTTDSTGTTDSGQPPATEPVMPPEADRGTVRPGVEQVALIGSDPGLTVRVVEDSAQVIAGLVDPDGTIAETPPTATVDEFGSALVRGLSGGAAYRLLFDDGTVSPPFETLDRTTHPDEDFYSAQQLPTDGLGYVTTRDGTTLSASVWLPGPADDGPYPTVVEYSGYTPSDPESAGFPDLFTAMGYAYVGVNVRGTGCSGGSFRYFEFVQSLDGYDVIEAVAAQPWVRDGRVGMVGISYPGISQLFVARTRPPSLAAVTPLSVLADSSISTLYPGGILNTGFAVPWTAERMEQAAPEGQQWAADRIADGDDVCAANQQLRLQNPDLISEVIETPFWSETAAEIAPRLFVDQITVPTFIAGAWQDEQTGGHFATMLDRFTGTDDLYVTMLNGLHTESISPPVFVRLVEFLDLYVAERTPTLSAARAVAPVLASGIFGTDDVALPDSDRFAGLTHAEALAAFESEPSIEVLFEQGAADGFAPLTPAPRFRATFESWPVPDAEPTRWFLNGDGVGGGLLSDTVDTAGSTTTYLALPDAVPATWYDGSSSGIWRTDVTYDWQRPGPGTYGQWTTDPLDDDTVIVGSGSVDLWVQSNLGDTDIEVTVSEIRPDGTEVYVQSGWLRASQRALDDAASTELRPVHTHLRTDAAPLPDGEFEPVRVELFPVAHPFRAGSRIRLTVDAPGGNRPVWEFDTIAGGEQVTIAHDDIRPSSVVLAVVDGIDVPPALPDCASLRGQPCRPAVD